MNGENPISAGESLHFPKDIRSADEFLKIKKFHAGNLDQLFQKSEKMNQLLLDPLNGTEFRKRIFNDLFKNADNIGLYERADIDTFLQMLDKSTKNNKIEYREGDGPEYFKKLAKERFLQSFAQKLKRRLNIKLHFQPQTAVQ